MKKIVLILGLALMIGTVMADIPLMIDHHGHLTEKKQKTFTGDGYFHFGFIDVSGNWLWTNDGTHVGESADVGIPDNQVILPVVEGHYKVRLGDTSLPNMVSIPSPVFDDDEVILRVIFSDGKPNGDIQIFNEPVSSEAYAYHALYAEFATTAEKLVKPPVPSGAIMMWYGNIAEIPEGWALCNGLNGTPDLRDKFTVGAGREYNIGDTGGEKTHILTIAEMPSHNHSSLQIANKVGDADPSDYDKFKCQPGDSSNMEGGDQPHENRPPYYALAFIMKL